LEFLPAPRHPESPAAEVHVWRAVAGTAPSDRILRQVLGLYLCEEKEIGLTRGERGKPRLEDEPGRLAFNLSHSGELTLVAVSQGREVGVDVEREKSGRDLVALAERALGPGDAAAVRAVAADERSRLFYELWSRHEARLKCLGVGLAGAPPGPPAQIAIESLPVDPGYAAAVAVTGAAVPVRCWTLDRPRPEAGWRVS
jgi:4'-phosphopantetheinyl transferase